MFVWYRGNNLWGSVPTDFCPQKDATSAARGIFKINESVWLVPGTLEDEK